MSKSSPYNQEFHGKPDHEILSELEKELRDTPALLQIEDSIRKENPELYWIIADTAHELSEGNPKSHATYFGSLLLLLSEYKLHPADISLPSTAMS